MLEIDAVSRRFGDRTVLDDVSFEVRAGRLTGFVGANGAGKTTTMRIVLGVLAPSAGQVRWAGHPVTTADRRQFGYLPEERGLYPKQQVLDQLVYFGRLHGMTRAAASSRATELLGRLGLSDRTTDRLDSLSLGNQQRVQIAVALLHEPIALVLDEPFSGLDPLAVDSMATLLREQVDAGVPVLFSSHQLELVEALCDDLVILAEGRVAAAGSAHELRRRAGVLHRLVLPDGCDAGWVRDLPGLVVTDVDGPRALVDVAVAGAEQQLLIEALRRGNVREFSPVVPALSDVFRELVR
jgi:ABC-2 type transport system ATP-binding protein